MLLAIFLSTLGYVPSTIANDRNYVKPSSEINAWLQGFVYQQFDTNKDDKAKKLLWVIQDLSLGIDSTQQGIHSFVKLKSDIYENPKQKDVHYQLINTFDSTWIIPNGNADFAQTIATAFDHLYDHPIELKHSAANKRFKKLTGTKNDIIQ